jgi:hypothetical protein
MASMRKLSILGVLATLFIAGCSGDATVPVIDHGTRTAVVASAQAAFRFSQANAAAEIGAIGAMPHDWTLAPRFHIYHRGVALDENTIRIDLSTSADASGIFGTITAEVTDPLPLPTTAVMTLDMTLRGEHVTGTLTGTLMSETERRVVADVQFTPHNGSLAYDLTLNQTTGDVEGTITAVVGGRTVVLSNIRKGANDSTLADATVNGRVVRLHWQADGSGTGVAEDDTGDTTIEWDSNEQGTMTFPDGQEQQFPTLTDL